MDYGIYIDPKRVLMMQLKEYTEWKPSKELQKLLFEAWLRKIKS